MGCVGGTRCPLAFATPLTRTPGDGVGSHSLRGGSASYSLGGADDGVAADSSRRRSRLERPGDFHRQFGAPSAFFRLGSLLIPFFYSILECPRPCNTLFHRWMRHGHEKNETDPETDLSIIVVFVGIPQIGSRIATSKSRIILIIIHMFVSKYELLL